jgi:hypothetical protein
MLENKFKKKYTPEFYSERRKKFRSKILQNVLHNNRQKCTSRHDVEEQLLHVTKGKIRKYYTENLMDVFRTILT